MTANTTALRPVTPLRPPLTLKLGSATAVPARSDLQGNHLLEALPLIDLQRWSGQLELVEIPFGRVLCESAGECSHVHFPTSSIVSLLSLTANGDCAEMATVGNDGVVGMPLLMGSLSSNGRAVVQSAGQAYRVRTAVILEEFNRGGAMMKLLLRYSCTLLTQVAQTAVCTRHHSVEQQVCRMILLSLDRVQRNNLQMTQEFLAVKVGVRRESVTVAALALRRAGLIRYARGCIEVLDRVGLEDRTCECYTVVKRDYERLFPMRHAIRPISVQPSQRGPDALPAEPFSRCLHA